MDAWEERYQRGETGWDRGGVSPALLHWLESGELQPCRLLVPGCGRGYEVVELAKRGFAVTAIDIAPSAVAFLQQRLDEADLTATVICADLFTYQPEQLFDAVYEQTCLCAIQPAARVAYEQRLYSWLREGGMLFALFMQTGVSGGPPFHCDVTHMQALFHAKRWQWPPCEAMTVPHHGGKFELGHKIVKRCTDRP